MLFCLKGLGPEAKAAVPLLSELLENSENNRHIREAAAYALGGIGQTDGIPALLGALDDQEKGIVGAAVSALGDIGPHAKVALPRLIQLL